MRLVHSGFLGDDWEAEYEALGEGDFMYLHLMAQYVTHFPGRASVVISMWRPESRGREFATRRFREALGVSGSAAEGDPVRFAVDGLDVVEGVLDFVSPSILGVRTDDALYRFLHSPKGVVFLGHHLYGANVDRSATEQAWRAWLDRLFASA